MARPSKFTEAVVVQLLAGIKAGLPNRLAAEAAGVSERTFLEWQAGHFPRGADPQLKAQFSQDLTRARGQGALRLVGIIQQAAPSDWRAAGWLLERRWPDDFAKRTMLTGADGGPIALEVQAVQTAIMGALADYPDARVTVAAALAALDDGDADR